MKKYINIDKTVANNITRILSITDSNVSPNGLEYVEIEYVEKPETTDLQIAYPMYNYSENTMFWVVIDYQETPTDILLQLESAKLQIGQLTSQFIQANETISLLVETQADILGGVI